jgi:hypothetical protein
MRNAQRMLVGKPDAKRPVGRIKRRWKDNIKMDLRSTRERYADHVELAYG